MYTYDKGWKHIVRYLMDGSGCGGCCPMEWVQRAHMCQWLIYSYKSSVAIYNPAGDFHASMYYGNMSSFEANVDLLDVMVGQQAGFRDVRLIAV